MQIILAVGTKLQAIITQMALEIKERHAVIQGIPLVQLSDHHFWFGRPHFIMFLIHFTLFQVSFPLIKGKLRFLFSSRLSANFKL